MHSLRASSNSHPSLNTQFPLDLLPRFLPSFERLDHVTSTRNIIIIIISPYPSVRRNRKERERTLVEDNSSWMALSLGFQKSRGESLVKRDDFDELERSWWPANEAKAKWSIPRPRGEETKGGESIKSNCRLRQCRREIYDVRICISKMYISWYPRWIFVRTKYYIRYRT